jgi:ribosomal protein S18 acetylase RimI-like enzyme
VTVLDEVRALAEDANAYTPLGPREERVVNEGWVLWLGRLDHPSWNVAQRFRLRPDEVEDARSEIHARLCARGRTACTWEVGSSATPPDLVERLLALGLVDDDEPLAVGMVLTEPPRHAAPAGIEVRRVETDEDALVAARIAAVAFGLAEPAPADVDPTRRRVRYIAYADGEPVGQASASFGEHGVTMHGGATLPEARGRGADRALVAARWTDAVARGTPALVTQAGAMSRPILARLGFREVCTIRVLLDRFASGSP